MSQKGDVAAISPAPAVAKGMGKGMAAALIALVCIGAFAGAGAGTYVTFRYVILPAFQGSNGNNNNNNNNNNCTTNCNNGNNGCTSNCQSGTWSESSNSVTMTITQYGYSSNYFNFTFKVTSTETMNSFKVMNGSNTVCSGTAPSGQGTNAQANTPTSTSLGLSNNGCSSASFQSGTTYSWTFGDTNGDSFSGSQFNFMY